MESITFAPTGGRTGIEAQADCWAMGAIAKPTKATAALPEDEQRHYFQLQLASDDQGSDLLYVFCDRDHFQAVADAMRADGSAVPVAVELRISRGNRGPSINVTSVKL